MRICRLVWNFPKKEEITYGLGPNFYYVSKEQSKLGLDVHVVSRRKLGEPSHEEIEGITIHRVGFPYNTSSVKKVLELNKALGVNLVHAHGTCGILYPLFRKVVKIPLVVHVHATTMGMKQHAYRVRKKALKQYLKSRAREEISVLRQGFFWSHADSLIAVSQAQKDELKALYNLQDAKIKVVHNGVDISLFRPLKDTQHLSDELQLQNKKMILFVGHFGLRKGVPYLIKAMPKVLKENPDAVLVCVGGTPKWLKTRIYWQVLDEMIRKEKLERNVRLIGEVPHHQLPYYYSLASVFAFPSLYEAFAKVIIEAMACGTPVIASRVGGIPEIIKHNTNGILIKPKDVDQLSEALNRLLSDTDFAEKMSRNARQTVEKSFTWRHTAQGLLRVYEEVLRKD